jgi:cytoplasmic iron level regulating protein YaaA (DUF328/UPF0246 family)
MITILSPAKTLDFEYSRIYDTCTMPSLLDHSINLIKELKNKSKDELMKLMGISQSLANINYQRYQNWNKDFNLSNSYQAVFCFKGGVYVGLNIGDFNNQDIKYSQSHLRILSGLYGILKPLDLMQPYRLEMGTKLMTERGNNLYHFWGMEITNHINDLLRINNEDIVVNLASNEYFKSIIPNKIKGNIIDVKFLDTKNGILKVISFFAKKARGAMASFIMKNKVTSINELKDFDGLGYHFNPSLSANNRLFFTR